MNPRNNNSPIRKSSVAAKQGVKGHNVRYVLGFGLAGVIGAFILLAIYNGAGFL